MEDGDIGADPASGSESTRDFQPLGVGDGDKIVKQSIGYGFVERAFVTESLEIQFKRFEFDTNLPGDVTKSDCAKIGMARFWTKAGKFRANDLNREIPSRPWVGKSFQLVFVRRFKIRHDLDSPW